ncbi:hypothetical protein EOPP23_18780 [Endozoicomonas sp. OPT23]|nr:hypothetical protein [Endozoicomonas sp. OPT23]
MDVEQSGYFKHLPVLSLPLSFICTEGRLNGTGKSEQESHDKTGRKNKKNDANNLKNLPNTIYGSETIELYNSPLKTFLLQTPHFSLKFFLPLVNTLLSQRFRAQSEFSLFNDLHLKFDALTYTYLCQNLRLEQHLINQDLL